MKDTKEEEDNEFGEELPVVDGVIGCCEVKERSTGDLAKFKPVLNVLGTVEHL